MSKCSDMTLALACWNNAGVPTQVFVHNEYRTAANGARTLHATRFTDANGVPVTVNPADVKPGACVPDTLVANPVHWGTPSGAFQFPNFPNLANDFPGSTVVADFFLHAIEFGGNVYGMDGLPFTATAPDLPWASAQTGIDAVLATLGLPAGSIVAAEDPATNQPVVLFDPLLVPSGYVFWAGPTGAGQYSNKLPATTPFVGATSPAASAAGCTEGKAWYSVATGALVRINTLAGADVTSTVNPLTLAEGACPAAAEVPADVEFIPLCDVSAAGVVTEFVRRTVTLFDAAGAPTTTTGDFANDLVTPYTPTGTVGKCNQDCDVAAPVGVVATWG